MEKKLTRSVDNRMFAGVAGGLGEYFGIDPTIVRILFVVLTLVTAVFPLALIYFILWVIMPEPDLRA